MAELGVAIEKAYDRMTAAEKTTPCRCAMIAKPHMRADCTLAWHRRSWHAGGPCSCRWT